MRRLSIFFKCIQVVTLSISLLPLSSIAECLPHKDEPGIFSRLATSVSDTLKRLTNPENIVNYCYHPNSFTEHREGELYASIPSIPKDFQAACGCFESFGVVPSAEERQQKYNRMKELKYRMREFQEFVQRKNIAENSMIAYRQLFPNREMPKACGNLFGSNAKLEGSESCKDDLAKLVKVQLLVEPFVLSPEGRAQGRVTPQGIRRNHRGRVVASDDKEQPQPESDNENTLVGISDSYIAFNRPRRALALQRAEKLAREEGVNINEAISRVRIKSINPREVAEYITSGIDREQLNLLSNRATGNTHQANQSSESGEQEFQIDQVPPFGNNEVDRAAAKMLAEVVRGGASYINQDFSIARKESSSDLFQNIGDNPKERIARILRISEERSSTRFTIPPKPLKQPVTDPQNPEFLEPKEGDEFEKAVFARYEQMTRTFNVSKFLRANPTKILSLDQDGVTLVPKKNIDQDLLTFAQEAYQLIDSASTLERACEEAIEHREMICLEKSDADLAEEPLLPEEINVLAAADFERGDEVEYGKIVCGSFIDWKNVQQSALRDYLGLGGLDQSFAAFRESKCDISLIPKAGDSRPLFISGCSEATTTKGSRRPMPPPPEKEVERNVYDVMVADENIDSDKVQMTTLDEMENPLPTTLSGSTASKASSPFLKAYSPSDTIGGGLAGAQERASYSTASDNFVGPRLPPGYVPKSKDSRKSPSLDKEILVTTESNLEPITTIPPSSLLGVDSTISSDNSNYVGAVDADKMTSNGFDMASAFQTNVTDTGRYSIYDSTTVSPLLPEIANAEGHEDYEDSRAMSTRDIGRVQSVVSQSDKRYDQLLDQYEEMKKELESIKGEKADKETNELIAELKKQIAELKDSRKELEEKIEKEKTLREIEAAKAVTSAAPTKSQSSKKSVFTRPSEPSFRPAAQPTTYGAEPVAVAPVRINVPAVNSQASYSSTSGSRKSFDEAPRLSDLSTGTLASGTAAGTQAAANTRVTTGTPSSSGLRLTAQAFDKLSSNDFQSLYESNKGGAIFVEKSVADGNGNRNLVVEKYVPEVIEGEVIYINQGEIEEQSDPVATEEKGPARAIASIAGPEVVVEEEVDLRRVKEVARYQDALYSPIHQQLIDKIQAAVAEGRR